MDSAFTLSIDWLAFTVLASNPQETMKVLGGESVSYTHLTLPTIYPV